MISEDFLLPLGKKQGNAAYNCCHSLKSSWLEPNIQRNEDFDLKLLNY